MKQLLLGCSMALLCATQLYAVPKQVVKSGTFVTADAGYGHLFTSTNEINTGGTSTQNSFVGSAGIGYAWAMDSFNLVGMEVDYFDNGQATYNSGTGGGPLKISSQAEGIMFSYQTLWENGINAFLKAGPVYFQQENDFENPTTINSVVMSGSDTKTGLQAMIVGGVGYYIARNLNVFIDGTYLFGHLNMDWTQFVPGSTPSSITVAASGQIKLGLSYQF